MGLSISTLRRYDDDDGILPSSYKTPGGHRRYEFALIFEMTGSISQSDDPLPDVDQDVKSDS